MDTDPRSEFGDTPAAASSANKARRLANRSDEEIKADIIETRSRVGWPELAPLPGLARNIRDASQYFDDIQKTCSQLQAVLDAQQVRHVYFTFAERVTIGATLPRRPTFLVYGLDRESGSWFHAVLRMARIVEDTQIDKQDLIAVEIIDQDFVFPHLLAIGKSHHLLHAWETDIAPAVMSLLQQKKAAWSLLSLVDIASRTTGKRHKTTVLLEVPDAGEYYWESLTKELSTIATGYELELEVWQSSRLMSRDAESWKLPQRMWGTTMQMGDGIAPTGDSCIGTLGGFITLEEPDRTQTTYGITNFHVVRDSPQLRDLLKPDPPRTTLKEHMFPETPSPHPISVPTDRDTDAKKEWLQHQITAIRHHVYGTASSQTGRAPTLGERAEWGDKKAQKQVDAAEEEIAGLERDVAAMEDKTKFHAGTLKAVSGHSVSTKGEEKLGLDWALVAIDESRDHTTAFPFRDLGIDRGTSFPSWVSTELTTWTTFAKSSGKLIKVGRMTGWTTGALNYADAYVNLDKNVGPGWESAFGTVVRCIKVQRHWDQQDAFAVPGDSGALVLDIETGACCGLLFGSNEFLGYGLVTQADVLFDSIERVTGCKVVEPRRLA